ncbi:MAG: hypothetical protein JXJ04_24900 [Spirochaetales bacterium]|nr:hypothetical protein [Spirochaetales bacterium]
MKKLLILGLIVFLSSLSSCIIFENYEINVHVDFEWTQYGDDVYIDYTLYNEGNVPLENVIVEFSVDTEDNNDFDSFNDITEWTNPVDLDLYDSYTDNFRIPLYGETAYGVSLVSVALDNPPDDDDEW